MFHSMELVPGASPYARTGEDVDGILRALEALLSHCRRDMQMQSCGLSEVADHI